MDFPTNHLLYTIQGPSSFSNERIEVFAGGSVAVLEDFRLLHLQSSSGRRKRYKSFQADKGHAAELTAFLEAVRTGGEMPIGIDSIFGTTLVSLAAIASKHRGRGVELSELEAELNSEPE